MCRIKWKSFRFDKEDKRENYMEEFVMDMVITSVSPPLSVKKDDLEFRPSKQISLFWSLDPYCHVVVGSSCF